MRYQCQTKRVEKVDADGRPYCVVVDVPYDSANESKRGEGILMGDQILFADGSWKEAGGGIYHCPPNDPEYPREVWKNILAYFSAKSNLFSKEFDKLQNRLLENEDTFKITLPNGEQTDALLRLQELASQIIDSEKQKRVANKELGREPEEFIPPVYTKQELSQFDAKEKQRKDFFAAVDRISKPTIQEDTRLSGTR